MYLCGISDIEGSGVVRGEDRTTFQRLGLTTDIINNLLWRQRSNNVRKPEPLKAGKSLGSVRWNQVFRPSRLLQGPWAGPTQCDV